jgi:hypothetical protein
LADNKLTDRSVWDDTKLAKRLIEDVQSGYDLLVSHPDVSAWLGRMAGLHGSRRTSCCRASVCITTSDHIT